MVNFDIKYEVAALVILALVTAHFIRTKRTNYLQTRIFSLFLTFASIDIILDIVASIVVSNAAMLPLQFNYFLNAAFLSMQFASPALLASYFVSILQDPTRQEIKTYLILCIPAVLGVLAMIFCNPFTHWFFYFTDDFAYTHGPFHFLIYANLLFYIVLCAVAAFLLRKRMTPTHLFAITVIVIIGLATIAFQMRFPLILVTGFGMALVILTMYLNFQGLNDEIDALTRLPTRFAFQAAVEHFLKKNPSVQFTLVVCDIRRFKIVNDLFGTKIADDVLIALGEKLKGFAGTTGAVARLEGDRFALCVPDSQLDLDALLAALKKDAFYGIVSCDIEVVLGLYVILDRSTSVSLMCDRALLAARSIKEKGIVRHNIYNNELRAVMIEETQIVNEMGDALEQGQFEMYLQPIYELASERINSAEALVRWNHPSKGTITPARFIELFEDNGFIAELDLYIYECACKQLASWRAEGKRLVPLSTNISRIDLANPRLLENILELAERYAIDPGLLKFEITESSYMQDTAGLIDLMASLRSHGFLVVIDDFGSGYSSLNMLKDTPVDQLKLDLRFLAGEDDFQRSNTIISTVVQLANELGLMAVAEGVETKTQVEFLKEIGCFAAQGYHYARPMTVNDFEKLLVRDG